MEGPEAKASWVTQEGPISSQWLASLEETGEGHREGNATTKAETGVVRPHAQGCLEPQGAGRSLSWGLWREHGPVTPGFLTSGLQNLVEINTCCFKLPVRGNLLQPPQDTDIQGCLWQWWYVTWLHISDRQVLRQASPSTAQDPSSPRHLWSFPLDSRPALRVGVTSHFTGGETVAQSAFRWPALQ